jgi:hypothetical protein
MQKGVSVRVVLFVFPEIRFESHIDRQHIKELQDEKESNQVHKMSTDSVPEFCKAGLGWTHENT